MALREQLQAALGNSYRVERELGGGGMSRVFLAEESALGRRVVIKILPPDIAAGVNVDRFKREIQTAARLQHPHIVPVLAAGEMDGIPYYTMPFVEGESLRARLSRGQLSIGEIISILRDSARALAYAHDHRIVHRDIKPDNVLLSGNSATVADFGIAKAIAAARSEGAGARPETLTSIGASIGTPAYMAPEQAAADPDTDHRADIYAFGCTAYEMLAGRPPFVEKSPQRLLAAHMSDSPQPVIELRPDTPTALAEMVMRCLEKDAQARPQDASAIVRVLDTVTSGSAHQPMPEVLLEGRGMLIKALAAYVAAFIFVAVLAKAAIVAIGLPDWVFPGALVVMALGLPVLLFTAYVYRTARRAATQTPTYTPGGSLSAQHGTMATLAMRASPHVSWRRTWLGGAIAVGTFVVVIGGYMVLRALGIGPAASLLAAGEIDRNEKVIVADFTGPSNDSSTTAAVTDAFRTALSQSRAVTVYSPTQMNAALRRMMRPAGSPIDFQLAREIATREGMKAVILGDLVRLGGSYVVSAQLLSAQTGQTMASFRRTAANDAELVPAIDRMARDMRGRIGESLRQVQGTPPLERVTTPSFEALKKYVQGSRLMSFERDFPRGSAMLEEAIALDSGFAMAYRRLAVEYSNRFFPDKAAELLQKAFDNRHRLTDIERYLVEGSYYQRGPRQDIVKSTAAYETLIELQPDFVTALNNVAINYRWQRDFVRAEQVLRRAMEVPGTPAVTYNQMIWVLTSLGRMDKAWQTVSVYDSLFPGTSEPLARRGELLYIERQYDSAATVYRRALAARANDRVLQSFSQRQLASIAFTQGRIREGERLIKLAVTNAEGAGRTEVLLEEADRRAMIRVAVERDSSGAVAILDSALRAVPMQSIAASARPYFGYVLSYAAAGKVDRARELLADFERSRRTITTVYDARDRQAMLGMIALAERRYDDAVNQFVQSDIGDCHACIQALLAGTLDAAGKRDSALVVYERYFASKDWLRFLVDPYALAVSHRRVGELYEQKGEIARAIEHYQKFLELWKNADPDLQAQVSLIRARVARLRDTERS